MMLLHDENAKLYGLYKQPALLLFFRVCFAKHTGWMGGVEASSGDARARNEVDLKFMICEKSIEFAVNK